MKTIAENPGFWTEAEKGEPLVHKKAGKNKAGGGRKRKGDFDE